MKRLGLLTLIAMFTLAPAAQAFYLGGSYLSTNGEFEDAVDDFETDDNAYKLYVGFQVFRFLDFEGTYRDLGDHVDGVTNSRLAMNLEAWDVAARGVVPLGRRLSVFARAGYANISREGELAKGGIVDTIDEDAWELTWGGGIEFELGRHLGLRAEWEEYDINESLSSFSAGAFFRF